MVEGKVTVDAGIKLIDLDALLDNRDKEVEDHSVEGKECPDLKEVKIPSEEFGRVTAEHDVTLTSKTCSVITQVA